MVVVEWYPEYKCRINSNQWDVYNLETYKFFSFIIIKAC